MAPTFKISLFFILFICACFSSPWINVDQTSNIGYYGTDLTVYGTGFENNDQNQSHCEWDLPNGSGYSYLAIYIDSTTIKCSIPMMSDTSRILKIFNRKENGTVEEYSLNNMTIFLYNSNVQVTLGSIYPSIPSSGDLLYLTLSQGSFNSTSTIQNKCKFGNITTYFYYLNRTTGYTYVPYTKVSGMQVYVSVNGGVVWSNPIYFDFNKVYTSSMTPTTGSTYSVITMNGNFNPSRSTRMRCLFANYLNENTNTTVVATYVTTSRITCSVPNLVTQTYYRVYVSDDSGYHYNAYTSAYFYFDPHVVVTLGSISPSSPSSGDTLYVTLSQGSFISSSSSQNKCKFGNTTSYLYYINSTTAYTYVPYTTLDSLTLSVSVNAGLNWSNSIFFNFRKVYTYSMSPTSGTTSTLVTMGGSFTQGKTAGLRCLFADYLGTARNYTATATYVSTSQITCRVPNLLTSTYYWVYVSDDSGYHYNAYTSGYFYFNSVSAEVTIGSITPNPPSSGDTLYVTLSQGYFNLTTSSNKCKFGDDISYLYYVNSTTAYTYVPYTKLTGMPLFVSVNGGSSWSGQYYFNFNRVYTYGMTPTSGVTSTVITMSGTFNSARQYRFRCLFADYLNEDTNSTVAATYHSSYQITCTVPNLVKQTYYRVYISDDSGYHYNAYSSGYFYFNSNSANTVTPVITGYVYYDPAKYDNNVTGSYFTSNTQCKLATYSSTSPVVTTTFISSNKVYISIPTGSSLSSSSWYYISCSNDGTTYSSTSTFNFIPRVSSISPSTVYLGQMVTVYGSGFSNLYSNPKCKMTSYPYNTVTLYITSWTSAYFYATSVNYGSSYTIACSNDGYTYSSSYAYLYVSQNYNFNPIVIWLPIVAGFVTFLFVFVVIRCIISRRRSRLLRQDNQTVISPSEGHQIELESMENDIVVNEGSTTQQPSSHNNTYYPVQQINQIPMFGYSQPLSYINPNQQQMYVHQNPIQVYGNNPQFQVQQQYPINSIQNVYPLSQNVVPQQPHSSQGYVIPQQPLSNQGYVISQQIPQVYNVPQQPLSQNFLLNDEQENNQNN